MKYKLITKLINLILNVYGKLYKFNCPFLYNADEFSYINIPLKEGLIIYYITWSFLYSDMHDELFDRYVKFIGLEYNLPVFLMSLLHEVGHHKVGNISKPSNMINITQYKKYLQVKSKEELELFVYYNIPDEYEASKWAVEFANWHIKSLTILSWILYPLINSVYKKHWNLIIAESTLYTEK